MKLLVGSVNKHRKPPARKAQQRFDVSRLKGDIVDDQGKLTTKGSFQDRVAQSSKSKGKSEELAEEKWNPLKSTLCETAESRSCNSDFLGLLLDLIHTVWRESKVPRDWVNVVLIPILKKGDLHNCDN